MSLYQESRSGMAVAPHADAARSGADILAEGGNAIEACIGMAATLSAVYPHMTGLGGDSFWVLKRANGTPQTLLAGGRSAERANAADYRSAGHAQVPYRGGDAALTVAGTVSGWQAALQTSVRDWRGRLPMSRLIADAVTYCRSGYRVTESQAIATRAKLDQLQDQPGFAPVFLRDGAPPAAGDTLTQPALADTLERLAADGLDDFYHGELARDIAADLARAGSPLRLEDIAAHHVVTAPPLQLRSSGATVYTTDAPTQGAATLMILGLFDRRPEGLATVENVDWLHWLVEATKQAFTVRNRELRDPGLMTVTAASLLDPAALDAMVASIDPAIAAPWGEGRSPADTTWFGAIDAQGNMVSCIQSIYHEFGSGVVLPTTGLVWHNRGASFSLDDGSPLALRPRTLPFHTLCPAMAVFDDGRGMVFGTMGGDGQPQTNAAVFTRYAAFGQPLEQAVSAPRWVLGRTWGDHSDNLKLESRFDPALIVELAKRRHDVAMLGPVDETVGHAGAIVRHPDGLIAGAADPRSDGAACTPPTRDH